jgi:hypothetical protein
LRRVDAWLVSSAAGMLRDAVDPLVVDLGFGAHPITTVELQRRLRLVRGDVRVVGLEIDPARVIAAAGWERPGLSFMRGGFELAGLRPVLVRALNVLRQYPLSDVASAWRSIATQLAPGGWLVDGTCDEVGRLGTWLTVDAAGRSLSLTLAANLATLPRPADFAQRLPKALIHNNVPGERVHALLSELDQAWEGEAAYAPFGPRLRFARAVAAIRSAGWPVRREPRRWRRGECTVAWPPV